MTGQIDCCCLFIEILDYFLVVGRPLSLDGCYSGDEVALAGSEDGFELEVIVLFFSLGLFGLVCNGYSFVLVNAAKVPAIGISFSNSFARNEGFSFVEGVALTKSTINSCLFRAVGKNNSLAIAYNLVILLFINIDVLEYLFLVEIYLGKRLFKDSLSEFFMHDYKTSRGDEKVAHL